MRLINQQGNYLETTGRHIIMFRERGIGVEAAKSWLIQLLRIIENEVGGVKFFNPFEAGHTPRNLKSC